MTCPWGQLYLENERLSEIAKAERSASGVKVWIKEAVAPEGETVITILGPISKDHWSRLLALLVEMEPKDNERKA